MDEATDRYEYHAEGRAAGGRWSSPSTAPAAPRAQFVPLVRELMPGAAIVAPRGDVSERGALRFFRRRGEGLYDMDDLAAADRGDGRLRRGAGRGRANRRACSGLGYSNGANILASVIFERPELFDAAVLMHPLIPWTPEPAPVTTRVLITAGERDPICPPDATRALEAWFRAQGAPVETHWHRGGHEIDRSGDRMPSPVSCASDGKEGAGMSVEPNDIVLEESASKGRYVYRVGGDEAEMTYLEGRREGLVIIDHTGVPDAFRGQGVGAALVARAVADFRAAGKKVLPLCPFAAAQFRRHPEWADLLQNGAPLMSWNPALDPTCPTGDAVDAIETLIVPRARDLGGFEVRRALPAPERQMVGPFIFFDQAGPAEFLTGQGVDVRPHPHIGLATVTYLFRGEFQHRDSLGTDQMIHPGAVNWMIAGQGRHAFRADQRGDAAGIRIRFSASRPGWRCPSPPRTTPAGFEHAGQGGAAGDRGRGRHGAADPRDRLGRAGAGEGVQRDVLCRRGAGAGRAGAAAGRARGPRALHRLRQHRRRRPGLWRRRR